VEDISALKEAGQRLEDVQRALAQSESRYRTAFQTSIDAININRMSDGTYIECNKAFLDIMGFTRDEAVGHSSVELAVWADPQAREAMADTVNRDGSCRDMEARFRKKNGEIFWGVMSASKIEIDGVTCVLTVTRDISVAKAAEQRLAAANLAVRLSEARYRTVFQTSLDPITISRSGSQEYVDVNQAFLSLMGFERDEVIGRTSLELNLWADIRDFQKLREMLGSSMECRDIEIQFRKKSGDLVWGMMSASIVEIDGMRCVLTIARDISNAKAAEDEIRSLAFFDPLTGLPNRRLLLERLRLSLAAGNREGRMRALLFVDLDNFKTLNDTLGHQMGDLLLQEAARRLSSCVREADTVGRLGGDEFVLMLGNLSEVPEEAATQAKAVGEKILSTVAEPYHLNGHECRSSASIGIAVFGGQNESSSDVLQQADIAMYQAKSAGRNTLRFFAPALQAAVNARAALEEDLRLAIRDSEFVLYYQPQIDRNRLVGAEALIRWRHPRRGILAPGEFIALAEETGLILPIGKWVLETACAQVAAWSNRRQTAHLSIAVNISARQFRQPEFVEQVLAALAQTGANAQRLKLELTESMLLDSIEEVIGKMTELKSHGLRFSLDDFGTGYSSLAYLKRLPLDQLKIDRSFVLDILADESSAAIAQTIISLSRAMGLPVIAEGVETEEQRDFLNRLGCHAFQGFLFSKPLPPEEFERLWLPAIKPSVSVSS
jgi:diguanylate cyclase (GGDEF)-like protein/PAS domain S-box-containing protein